MFIKNYFVNVFHICFIELRHERLQYARFMQEITNAIIQKNLITEHAIEKLFELHIDRNGGELDQVRAT